MAIYLPLFYQYVFPLSQRVVVAESLAILRVEFLDQFFLLCLGAVETLNLGNVALYLALCLGISLCALLHDLIKGFLLFLGLVNGVKQAYQPAHKFTYKHDERTDTRTDESGFQSFQSQRSGLGRYGLCYGGRGVRLGSGSIGYLRSRGGIGGRCSGYGGRPVGYLGSGVGCSGCCFGFLGGGVGCHSGILFLQSLGTLAHEFVPQLL